MSPSNSQHCYSRRVGRRQPNGRTFRPLLEELEVRVVPQATLTSLSTNSVPEGSPSFTLAVNGSHFDSTAVVKWNGTSLATMVVNSSQVKATVPASLLVEETNSVHGAVSVDVFEDGVNSNALPFTITEAPLVGTGGFTINGVEGHALTNITVATFVDTGGPENPADPGDYTASINWGDNTAVTTGTISGPNSSRAFTVTGSHTYTEESNAIHSPGGKPSYVISVTITHETAPPVTVTDNAFIAEAPIVATGGFVINGVETLPITNATVATFIDTGGPENAADPGDYTATINWGDSTTPSAGKITGPNSSGVFTVTGSHTYAEDGENEEDLVDAFPITVTINHETAPPVAVTSTANISEETITAKGGLTITGVEGHPLTNVVLATFSGGNNCSATINWGDGTTSTGTINPTNLNDLFTVTGSHTYAEESNTIHTPGGKPSYVITVTISCPNMAPASVTDYAVIAEAPIMATGGFTINGVEGHALTNVKVATFIDAGGPEPASVSGEYAATISWGDGTTSTGTITGPGSGGVFTVTGSHTYTEESNQFHTPGGKPSYIISVTITHETAPPVAVTDNAFIAEAPLVATGGFTINGVEGHTLTNVTVATFIDTGGPEPASVSGEYAASINWGDNTAATAGTITGPGTGGVFTVTGSHSYTEESNQFHTPNGTDNYVITVTITHESAPPVAVTDNAFIAEAPLVATGGLTINGVEGQALTNAMVATFIDTGGPEDPSVPGEYAATIDWGDGSTPTDGTISSPDQNGVFTVTGSHSYTEESNQFHTPNGTDNYVITVTITHETAPPVAVTDNAFIAEAPLVATGGLTINGVEGQALTNAMVATFIDTGGPEDSSVPGEYAATIDWGDGSTPTDGTISSPDQNGVFTVTGSHSYTEESNQFHTPNGTDNYVITVTITHESAPPVAVTDNAFIAEAPLVATGGLTINGVEGQALTNAMVATFIDTGGPEDPSVPGEYAATIDWGDGSTPTDGTISSPDQNGVFTVTGSHSYTEESNQFHTPNGTDNYVITVTITHETAPPVAVTDNAFIAEAPLVATGGLTINGVEGQALTNAMVATFIDTGGPEDPSVPGEYAATIDWGDGSTPTDGTISSPDQNGVFTVTGSYTYSSADTFTITVTITHESAPPVTVTDTAGITGQGGGGATEPGQPFTPLADAILLATHSPLGMIGKDAGAGQSNVPAVVPAASTGTKVLLSPSYASVQAASSAPNDSSWERLLLPRGNRVTDPSGWATDQLVLALYGTAR